MISPANFEQKIGYDRVRAEIEALCNSEAAVRKLNDEQFWTATKPNNSLTD